MSGFLVSGEPFPKFRSSSQITLSYREHDITLAIWMFSGQYIWNVLGFHFMFSEDFHDAGVFDGWIIFYEGYDIPLGLFGGYRRIS